MLGEMLRLVNGEYKNEKFHLMSILHISRIFNACLIDLQIQGCKLSSGEQHFLQFQTAFFFTSKL